MKELMLGNKAVARGLYEAGGAMREIIQRQGLTAEKEKEEK